MKKQHKKFLLNASGKRFKAETLIGVVWKYLTGKAD